MKIHLTIRFAIYLKIDRLFLTFEQRTSGTEPKIKYYLEGQGSDPVTVKETLRGVVDTLRDDWMEASKNGLRLP